MPPRRRPHEARPNRHAGGRGRGPGGRSEDELGELLAERPNPLVLLLDGVQDPHNLGAILRSADAAGVDAVVAPKDRAAGITETVRRVSVGAADAVPFFRVTNLARTMSRLKEAGLWLVGTSDHGTQSIYDTDLSGPLVLVMGAEETGLRRLTEEGCDFLVRIPMGGTVECLNVSVAAGVCLFEAVRQRRGGGEAIVSGGEVTYPVRVLSDLHLGHPASRIRDAAMLRPLLEGAGTVVFNGDTCEQSFRPWRRDADALHADLLALCGELGVRPLFLTGNHDPHISERGWLDLGGVFVTHGDMIFPTSAPWSWEYLGNRARIHAFLRERDDPGHRSDLAHRYETVQGIHEIMVPEAEPRRRTTGGGSYFLSALWPPQRSFNMLRVWITMAGRAEHFVQRYRPGCEVFLFGHFHRPGVWRRGSRLHCNTGSFMQGMPATLAELDGTSLGVRRVEERGGSFVAGRALGSFGIRPQESRRA